MKNRKIEISLEDFKTKKDRVQSDVDLSNYLRVFMNTVTSSYRISELIDSGQFQLAEKGNSVIVNSAIDLLSLVPNAGPALKVIATKAKDWVVKQVTDAIKQSAVNTVESFYHKEIEEVTELVCMNMLAGNTDLIRKRIEEIENYHKENRGDDPVFNWIENRLNSVSQFVKNDLDAFNPHKFLDKKYKKASEKVAYRDGWYMVEFIGQGKLIYDSAQSKAGVNIGDYKMNVMEKLLEEIITTKDDELDLKKPGFGDFCGLKCKIF